MRQSNGYIIFFTVILTIVVGGILAGASIVLGPAQKKSIELETKTQILSAVRTLVEVKQGDDILAIYKNRISSTVVDYNGNEVTKDEKGNKIMAENVDVLKNYKKKPEDRIYPVFKLRSSADTSKIEAYVLPVYGNGLWDKIWGYVAIGSDLETIVGASFDHKAETPGLGQRIATQEIQDRFVGKKIVDEKGQIVSVEMTKGEHGGGQASMDYYKDDPHHVDGMSGATLTGKGLNAMLKQYLQSYKNYFDLVKRDGKSVATNQ
ncbi:MAG: NADH:ubiquinone reductase (Na(+)-transporting) subunit C [Bacteroidia bacterium]|nr:NADH:ubiquinone reductase (Na(+)-transporting) subunit C [Bacteroidia bacterium]